jgi:hypothetical protein
MPDTNKIRLNINLLASPYAMRRVSFFRWKAAV